MTKTIESAPTDGRKVTVQWRDRDGVENSSIAFYRSGADPQDAGWWTYTDSDTLKRIKPHSWVALSEQDDEAD